MDLRKLEEFTISRSNPLHNPRRTASSAVYYGSLGNNYFAQITHILGNFCKGEKIFHFSSGTIYGQLL